MTGGIKKSIFRPFAFFQKRAMPFTLKKTKSNPESILIKAISIPVEKRTLQIAEKGLNEIILKYIPNIDSQDQQRVHKEIINYFSSGYRVEPMKEKFAKKFLIAPDIAEKLAQHSLSFLSAKYNQARYQDMGIEKYRWSTCNDSRVREDHKVLHGKVFTWDSPPIADEETGDRYNPGEAPDCRCIAIALIE